MSDITNNNNDAQSDHPELYVIQKLVQVRRKQKKTQADIAASMNTTASAIARLESGGGKKRHSPSLRTLRSYAAALECHVEFNVTESA